MRARPRLELVRDDRAAVASRILRFTPSQPAALGNTTAGNGAARYHYDAFNRLDSAAGMAYYVSPEGQRLRKTGAAGTMWFAPDRAGALLAEQTNGTWVDYLWLNGRPIGRIAGGQVAAIHTDQVGRPEAVTDASHAVIWRAHNFAFGQTVVAGNITLNLGLPRPVLRCRERAMEQRFPRLQLGAGAVRGEWSDRVGGYYVCV